MGSILKSGYPGELRILGDAEQLAHAAAEMFVNVAAESIGARGRFRVALSGGNTPRRVYEVLATSGFSSRVDWGRVDIFWGDERYVPPDDRESNYRMANEAMLHNIPVPLKNVHRVPTEIAPPSAAAEAYEEDLRQCFGESPSIPRFDLIHLGLGTNGHIASLFPHSPALHERSRLVLADFVNEVNMWRISMTAPVLNSGRQVAFLIAGQQKAEIFREVLLGPRAPERLPAQLIAPEGKLVWLTDAAAAAMIPGGGIERRTA